MCPLCLTTLVVTVASTTGAGAAMTAVALRIRRSAQKTVERTRTAATGIKARRQR